MRTLRLAVLLIPAATAAFAQQWKFGAVGGVGLFDNVSVTGTRYEYMQSDLRLSSGGQSAQFSGAAHAVHYDAVFHTGSGESRVQAFAALGLGLKDFVGNGTEAAYQPLSQFGYFTKTSSWKPMGTVAAGVAFALNSNLSLRAEVRDYMTAFPTAVLTPAPGVKFGSFLNEVVPMISIVYQK